MRAEAEAALRGLTLGEGARAALLAHDAALKDAGLNPGTSADLTVATLFLDALARLKARPTARTGNLPISLNPGTAFLPSPGPKWPNVPVEPACSGFGGAVGSARHPDNRFGSR